MNEVALFESALRAAVPSRPDPRLGRDLVPRLAQVARASLVEAETHATRRRQRSRIALIARVGIAVALIPLVFAGLAFAGVKVPGVARSAFDSVGITLPNQHSDEAGNGRTTTGNDVSSAAKSAHGGRGGNSAAAHRHALQQRSKARGKALGHSRGRAIGLTGSTPPGRSGQTGPAQDPNSGASTTHTTPTHPAPVTPTAPEPRGKGLGRTK